MVVYRVRMGERGFKWLDFGVVWSGCKVVVFLGVLFDVFLFDVV